MTCKANSVQIGGNITRDPELRHSDSGMAVCNFTVAVDQGWGDRKTTAFMDCTLFGKRAEAFAKAHSKGSGAFIEGELKQESWESKKTGEKRSKIVVIGRDWRFNDSKPKGDAAPVSAIDADETPF